jgi:hypothetical protein
MLHIGARNPNHVYTVNNVNISVVNSVKDLGVHVNCDLNWSLHVNEVVKKANKISNVILHGFRCHNVDLYMSAFNTYVKPVVEYCNYVWNPVLCRDIDVIENIQRSYTRRVYWKCGLPRISYADRLEYLDSLSLECSRIITCLTMFYKIYNKFVCCNVLDDFSFPAYMSNLRGHNKRLLIPFCRSSCRKEYFTFRFLRVWNNLPVNTVSTNVTKTFMNNVRSLDMNTFINCRY